MREDWAPEHQVEIEKKAYYLWEAAGRPNDQSLDFWVQAEEIYKEEYVNGMIDYGNSIPICMIQPWEGS